MEHVKVAQCTQELKIITNIVVKIYAVKERSLTPMEHVACVLIIQEQLNLGISISLKRDTQT